VSRPIPHTQLRAKRRHGRGFLLGSLLLALSVGLPAVSHAQHEALDVDHRRVAHLAPPTTPEETRASTPSPLLAEERTDGHTLQVSDDIAIDQESLEDRDTIEGQEYDDKARDEIAPSQENEAQDRPSVPNLMPTEVPTPPDFLSMETTRAFPHHSPYRSLGEYDWRLTKRVLAEQNATPAHDAEDTMICAIRYFAYDIFLPDEPFPLFLNKLHATTREDVLRHRASIEPGDTYSVLLGEDVREQIWDTEIFSTVVAMPVENPEKACVDLYVITRDLWSLRLGFKPQISGGVLEKLELSIVETNFLGLNDSLGLGFSMDQGAWEIGPVWSTTWPGGVNLDIQENFRLVFDREFGGYDGIRNELRVERPLRSSWDVDAWFVDTSIKSARKRVFDGRRIHAVEYRDVDTGETYSVDERWHELRLKLDGGYVRAWGLRYKTLVTAGAFVDLRQVRAAPMDDGIPETVLEQFRIDRLPRQERAIGPTFSWEWYSNRYFHLTNYERFEISESYRKGIHLKAELRYSDPIFGADVRFIDGTLGARYVAPLGEDAFWDAATMGRIRWGADGFVDRRMEFSTRLVMPSGPLGRFVTRGWVRLLRADDANERFRIGAAEGLRGERGHVAEGHNAWIANIEWRSKPVEVLSTFLGFAAFVDLGSAWEQDEAIITYASIGAGLRFMAPQAMALPVAIDVSLPVGYGIWKRGMPAPVISLRFGQVFEPTSNFVLDEFYQ